MKSIIVFVLSLGFINCAQNQKSAEQAAKSRTRMFSAIGCLNTKAQSHDSALHVSSLRTATNDTVDFMPLCNSCFDNLSPNARLPFYEMLIKLYENWNWKDIERQVKDGL